ncbi:hypothetical protein [Stenotrophomonas maltophilia]|uniref:Portal protein n=1 Tax=Stenotrophomonas maltophilia TaxID=40324 RepID=A0A4S2D286_STEMA|nr:hypothetical protein [Stenotrophomonas maltophilia]TGY35246.1 hypothetical protein E5352_05870 [Stenotrophomonas maltophilia]
MTPETNEFAFADALDADAMAEQERAAEANRILQEEADVAAWLKRIEEAREFDKNARKGYAIDRRYCEDSVDPDVYDVSVPIAGTYVNILTGFLYARNPETSVQPADSAGPSRIEDAKMLSRTLEIVIANLWKRGKLKAAADQMVRSGLTIGIGWMKAAWHRETERDPASDRQITTLRGQIAQLQATERQLAAGDAPNPDELRAQYEQQLASLEDNVEQVIYSGLCIDFVRGEDMQVAISCPTLKDYLSSPWNAQRIFRPLEKAKAEYPEVADRLTGATLYYNVQPSDAQKRSGSVSDTDADAYSTGGSSHTATEAASANVCIWELWNRETGQVLTLAVGLKRYLRAPFTPDQKSTRFYPFFQWAPLWVDGRRHPQSLVDRSRSLLDEYNRTRTNYREHRRRAIPKLGFDAGAVEPEEANKMKAGAAGEMVPLNLNGASPNTVVFPIQYNQIDAALYDTATIRSELELIWGIQEALSSTITVAKTATEADIQDRGTESRMGYQRDTLDETLSDLSVYTAEVSMSPNGLTHDDVVAIAGPEAFWINVAELGLMDSLIAVDIRAGSSGKPATAMKQQQWSVLLPQLQQAVVQIGEMRGATPLDIADSLEQLVVETIKRTGDTGIDPYTIIPQAPPPMVPGMPGAPGPDGLPLPVANDPAALAMQDPGMQLPPEMLPPELPAA